MCFVVGTNFNAKDMEPAQNVELIKSLFDAIDMGNRPGWFVSGLSAGDFVDGCSFPCEDVSSLTSMVRRATMVRYVVNPTRPITIAVITNGYTIWFLAPPSIRIFTVHIHRWDKNYSAEGEVDLPGVSQKRYLFF